MWNVTFSILSILLTVSNCIEIQINNSQVFKHDQNITGNSTSFPEQSLHAPGVDMKDLLMSNVHFKVATTFWLPYILLVIVLILLFFIFRYWWLNCLLSYLNHGNQGPEPQDISEGDSGFTETSV